MSALLSRLESSPEPFRDLNIALGQALGLIDAELIYTAPDGTRSAFGNCDPWPDWTGVTDRAVQLLVRVLPGYHVLISSTGAPVSAGTPHCLWRARLTDGRDVEALRAGGVTGPNCAHPATAICAAIVKVKGL